MKVLRLNTKNQIQEHSRHMDLKVLVPTQGLSKKSSQRGSNTRTTSVLWFQPKVTPKDN